jgi:hypothetical protein
VLLTEGATLGSLVAESTEFRQRFAILVPIRELLRGDDVVERSNEYYQTTELDSIGSRLEIFESVSATRSRHATRPTRRAVRRP